MIIRKSGLFYIINNGDNAFRVNDALLNPNEASPLGIRAVINVSFVKRNYFIQLILFRYLNIQ
jgi:hypothetical protein